MIEKEVETYEEMYGLAKKERMMMAMFKTTMRASAGLKQLAFWRRTISSMRGCCHLPGVETAGEALWAAEGVAGPFCGVNEEIGWTTAFLALVAGD